MLKSIEIGGELFNADHWFDLGLPDYLHHCLDGTKVLYLTSGRLDIEDGAEKLRAIFSHRDHILINKAWVTLEKKYLEHDKYHSGIFLYRLSMNIIYASDNTSAYSSAQQKKGNQLKLRAEKSIKRLIQISEILEAEFGPSESDVVLSFLWDDKRIEAASEETGHIARQELIDKAHTSLRNFISNRSKAGIKIPFSDLLQVWYEEEIQTLGAPKGQRPNSGNYEKREFCSFLAELIYDDIGESAFTEIAAFASALYTDTDEDYVRKVIKRKGGAGSPQQT